MSNTALNNRTHNIQVVQKLLDSLAPFDNIAPKTNYIELFKHLCFYLLDYKEPPTNAVNIDFTAYLLSRNLLNTINIVLLKYEFKQTYIKIAYNLICEDLENILTILLQDVKGGAL